MMFRSAVWLVLLTAVAPVLGIELSGSTKRECAVNLRKTLAETKGLPEATWANRFVALAMAEKVTFDAAGNPSLHRKALSRPFMIVDQFQAVEKTAAAAPLPSEYKDLLLKSIGGTFLYPIRQGPPRIGVRKWQSLINGLPAGSRMVTIGDDECLAAHIAGVYPDFEKLSWLRRMLVYDGLAAVNPLVEPVGSYRVDAGRGDGVPGIRRADVGVELTEPQIQYTLYELDPETRLMPEAVVRANAGKLQGEALVVPVGDGKARVRLYRIPPGGRVLIPTAEYLAGLADPEELNLRNGWLCDLSLLAGLDPVTLDLRGNDAADIAALAGMKRLRELKLDNNPLADLGPLRGLPLVRLEIGDTRVTDLSPLAGMKLQHLVLRGSGVTDLSPLAGMPVNYLDLSRTQVTNLSPLADMPLEYLRLNRAADYAGFEVFDALPQLTAVDDVPRDTWIREYRYLKEQREAPPPPEDDCDVKPPPVEPKPPPLPEPNPEPERPPLRMPKLEDLDLDF